MQKTYMIENVDCANCAAKIENRIKRLHGVDRAELNFFMETLTLEAENPDGILEEAEKQGRKIEAKFRIRRPI